MKHVSILALALCITACGGGQSQTFAQEGANKPTPTPTPAPTPTPEPTPTPSPTPAPPEPGVHYVNGQVLIMWAPPSHRENGDQLTPSEIGGYEVRFREYETPTYTYLLQKPNAGDAILINYLEGYYEFEVAAFDTNGLYSRFVPVTPQ